jgi:DUF4097 and DUF4098 domain-containing protein YvlB
MSNGSRPRSHIFSGLLLILLGAIFLLNRFNPALGIGHLFRLYWPVLLILWGIAKLIDHLAAQKAGQARPPLLSGGEAALLILIAFVASGFIFHDWIRDRYPDFDIEMPPFHQSYSQSQDLPPQTIPSGARLTIETGRGNVVVSAAEGSDLRVHAVESAAGSTESAARERMQDIQVVVERTGDGYRIHPLHQDEFRRRVSVDLNVEVPKTASVTASSARGDIRLTGIGGNVEVLSRNGDVEVRDAGSNVSVDMQKGDARIMRAGGNVRIAGRGDDVNISDVSGDATVDGPFVGTLRIHNAAKTTRCTSPWADLTTGRVTGQIEIDSGDISLSNFAGPTRITAHNKDISLENAAGRLDVTDAHGGITVTFLSPPREEVSITNDSGDVDVTLPGRSSFEINAVSRSGDVESDFQDAALKSTVAEETGRLSGKIGTIGPKISIASSYGTIHLHKSP